MKPKNDLAGNERGFVLIATMVILLLLLVLGLSANTTSTLDLQIAGNDKTSQMAFFNADAGIYSSPKMISAVITAGGASSFNPSSMYGSNLSSQPAVDPGSATSSTDFYNQIMGFDTSNATFTFPLDSQTVSVSIQRTGQKVLAGGGAEFASGASGVGSGSAGGVAIKYSFDSTGPAPDSAQAELLATYLKVPGTAGGL